MKLSDIGNLYDQHLKNIAELAGGKSLWSDDAEDVLARAKGEIANVDDLLQLLHEMQRLNKVQVAGLGNNAEFRAAVLGEQPPLWKEFTSPPVDIALQHGLGDRVYNIRPGKGDVGFIGLSDGAAETGRHVVEKCLQAKAPFLASFTDYSFNALVLNHATKDGVKSMAANHIAMMQPVNRRMQPLAGAPDYKTVVADKEKARLFSLEASMQRDVYYTLTHVPTRKDAELDGIEYHEYLKLFFEMCDQPWDAVSQAQQSLIAEFNAASKVRLTNIDGTDLSMELVDHDGKHFTFCNSLIAKNVPGSEIFSAPRRDSVNGVVVSRGRFSHGTGIIENLRMEFKDGNLVSFDAEKGRDAFAEALKLDEGVMHVGELGIGTNPHLNRHVMNTLLVEKIGGSFHLALGQSYTYTEYEGVKVKVDNGNRSATHWDITTLLRGRGGRIYLDGRMIMDDGKWLDPKYDVLNRGWEAIPDAQRPPYWQDYYKKKKPQPKP